MKKRFTTMLVIILALSLLIVGCQGNTGTSATTATTKGTQSGTTAGGATATTAAAAAVPFKSTLEFSILSTIWSPYDAEHTLLDPIMKATNTKINIEWAPTDNFDTKVNTILASGNIPDVIMGASTVSLINQGAIVALDDYYAKDAPNLLAALTAEDYAYLRNVNDGHIYSLVYTFDFQPLNSWMLRSDWLTKLGLKTPTTWDEWLTFWRAVRDQDVNGDGDVANEIPITGEASLLMEAFGIVANNGQFCTLPNGGYSVIYEHPNYRKYLETMAQLYSEKLLDQEFATRVMAERYKIMDSNLGASTLVAAEQAKLSTVVLRQTVPAATCLCVAPPVGPLGDQKICARNKVAGRGVVTVNAEKSKKVDKIVQFFDWFYSADGAKMMNYGVEGTNYTTVNGKPVLKAPYIESFVNARKNGLIFQPFPFLWQEDNYMQILLMGKKYEELDDVTKIFYDGLFLNKPYFAYAPPTLVTDAYSKYSTDLLPKLKELQANTIAGRITVDQFYIEYNKLKPQGLQDIIDQAAKAWKTVSAG